MNSDQNLENSVQELQVLERELQGFLMQKQSIQVELNEIANALEELAKADDEVYKMLGGIMVRSEKSALLKELGGKKKVAQLRVDSIEKQEKLLNEKASLLRKEINDAVSKRK